MRNALTLPGGFIVSSDNSGGIGEKKADVVHAKNDIVSYFAARVALLEQWAAFSEVESVVVHNFTGKNAWKPYKEGVNRLLKEVNLPNVLIGGSSESNVELLQSAMSVTMIGRRKDIVDCPVKWFIYGQPLVGNEVLKHIENVADIRIVKSAIDKGLVARIWPVGSKGIQAESRILMAEEGLRVISDLNVEKSAGPCTVILLGVPHQSVELASKHFNHDWHELVTDMNN